jgi:hypothetical protein
VHLAEVTDDGTDRIFRIYHRTACWLTITYGLVLIGGLGELVNWGAAGFASLGPQRPTVPSLVDLQASWGLQAYGWSGVTSPSLPGLLSGRLQGNTR